MLNIDTTFHGSGQNLKVHEPGFCWNSQGPISLTSKPPLGGPKARVIGSTRPEKNPGCWLLGSENQFDMAFLAPGNSNLNKKQGEQDIQGHLLRFGMTGPPKTYLHRTWGGMTGCLGKVSIIEIPLPQKCSSCSRYVPYKFRHKLHVLGKKTPEPNKTTVPTTGVSSVMFRRWGNPNTKNHQRWIGWILIDWNKDFWMKITHRYP